MKYPVCLAAFLLHVVTFCFCAAVPLLAYSASAPSPSEPVLIPRPERLLMAPEGGTFTLTPQAPIYYQSAALKPLADELARILAPVYGAVAPRVEQKDLSGARQGETRDCLYLELERGLDPETGLGAEGYSLQVRTNGLTLTGGTPQGLFYAIQTLRQLLPEAIESRSATPDTKWSVPCLTIEDRPRFARRGLMLDCSRHFYTKDDLKRVIDLLARYKMSSFHWHLTDAQAWRLEIKKYPKLIEIGARRISEFTRVFPDPLQGGFYTQADVREIVAYAAARYVTIIPEIEMPGHSTAALVSYPEFACPGAPAKAPRKGRAASPVYCPGNDHCFEFLQDVLTEVMALFPSREIHIGGDECPKVRWKACPLCQARIKAEGLKNENDLQSYFMRRMTRFLNDHGRRAICWDEVLQEGLHEGIVVQEWRLHKPAPEGAAAKAAQLGMEVIVSSRPWLYLNMPLLRNAQYNWGTATNLADVYNFEPVPEGITPQQARNISGGECCIWCEHVSPKRLDYFMFPRLLAVAEVLWSPSGGKNFQEFQGRVKATYPRLAAMGVNCGPAFAQDLKTRPDPGEER